MSFILIFVTKNMICGDLWYFGVILNTSKHLILVFSCMFDGIFEALKINFPPQFYPQQVKSIPNIECRDKNYQLLYFGGSWGQFEKKILTKIQQKLSFKKYLIISKIRLFQHIFWKIIIYFLKFIQNFHIFINFRSLNDEL